MAKTALYAVLTGDLVRSTGLSPDHIARVRNEIEAGAEAVAGWQPGLLAGGPEFFRGDAWQLALSDPRLFLRASVFLRARLLAMKPQADTRIAIGLGPIKRLEPEVSHSIGSAFTLSGRTLDNMKRRRQFEAGATASSDESVLWLAPLLSLCGAVVSRWKPKQAQIACLALDPAGPTQKEIADHLHMTQQGVSDAIVASDFRSVLDAVVFLEGLAWAELVGEDEG